MEKEFEIEKYIRISMQDLEELTKVIKFNEKNNFEYILKEDNNLMEFECIAKLLENKYKYYYDKNYVYFYHEKEEK